MLALTLMSFTLGMDLGLVLAKGVFFSLLCIFTVLPGLVLIFDGADGKDPQEGLYAQNDQRFGAFAHKRPLCDPGSAYSCCC